jgi:transcription antitermination protein NusB
MPGTRHKARMLALQALYEVDAVGRPPETVIERMLADADLAPEVSEFARALVSGTAEHKDELDGHIKKFAPAWPLDQIAIVDRNILRLAIFEILYDNKVPIKVVVNEAVELAKSFGSDGSAKFINGVLGAVSVISGR